MKIASNLFGRALRESGQALDRLGLTIAENEIYRDHFSRHRPVMHLFDKRPLIAEGAFVAPNASVVGKVLLFDKTTVWYGAVVRGDKSKVVIGHGTSIQDRAVITTETELDTGFPPDVDIGTFCYIGPGAIVTSSIIHNLVQIGQGSIIGKGSVIESEAIIAAGSVLPPGTFVGKRQFFAGNPAKYIRDVTLDELDEIKAAAEANAVLAEKHKEEFLPFGTVYQHAEKLEIELAASTAHK